MNDIGSLLVGTFLFIGMIFLILLYLRWRHKIEERRRMGGLYFVSGVQIGMLKDFAVSGQVNKIMNLLEEIESNQILKRVKIKP